MNFVMTDHNGCASHIPIIPATPANTGGAGNGSLNAKNIKPHTNPVIKDIIVV
jgi:hypothetical protein